MDTHWRIDVLPREERFDVLGRGLRGRLLELGLPISGGCRGSRVYFLDGPFDRGAVERIAAGMLADPVTESYLVSGEGDSPASGSASTFEVHLRPGVMDPVAASAQAAIAEWGRPPTSVRTARRYELEHPPSGALAARLPRILGNDCIEQVLDHARPAGPPPRPGTHPARLERIDFRRLGDAELERLSRNGHLFLSLNELHAMQEHYRRLNREPTALELETFAQTWSEHCVHKTLRSAIAFGGAPMPLAAIEEVRNDADVPPDAEFRERPPGRRSGHVELDFANLLKETIVRATDTVSTGGRGPRCLSVFRDNAGIIAFDPDWGIAFKVETHNHPSAIEPYGGSATGVGGCIRDVIGCGLAAKPLASTDVFCVAPPDWPLDAVPRGVIHPRHVLHGIVAGVRDYGNRMGIPTVNGAVHFDPRYLGNPLVYCGCVGLIPRERIDKAARAGDLVVVLGGRTGRDGIHGATFSSAELTDSHADEFSHAVQIGNAIEEKRVLDAVLAARDFAGGCLYSAITDCGAGGLSSAVGEMAEGLGAEIDLERVPLKYAGLSPEEIWISESQERMVLAVPPDQWDALAGVCRAEQVEATSIGRFTDSGRLVVRFRGEVFGELDLAFLHGGPPREVRRAEWDATQHVGCVPDAPVIQEGVASEGVACSRGTPREHAYAEYREGMPPTAPTGEQPVDEGATLTPALSLGGRGSRRSPESDATAVSRQPSPDDGARGARLIDQLLRRLSHPSIAAKEWIVRQYDHEVQGRSAVKPLVGARGDGPGDAAVLRPLLDSPRGIAIGCGLCPHWSDLDPYWMAVMAVDEAVRNVVCVGGDPERTAILDNFCWGRTDDPRQLGALVRACQACHDAAVAYGTPFISGKDSLNNEFALHADDAAAAAAIIRDWESRFGWGVPGHGPWLHGSDGVAPPERIRNGRLAIPPTLLISAVSIVADTAACVTMDLKQERSTLYLVGQPTDLPPYDRTARPAFNLAAAAAIHAAVADMIREGLIVATHDVSDGGLLTAAAEMAIAGEADCVGIDPVLWLQDRAMHGMERATGSAPGQGATGSSSASAASDDHGRTSRPRHPTTGSTAAAPAAGEEAWPFYFGEYPAMYIVEVKRDREEDLAAWRGRIPIAPVGYVRRRRQRVGGPIFQFRDGFGMVEVPIDALREAWKAPLRW